MKAQVLGGLPQTRTRLETPCLASNTHKLAAKELIISPHLPHLHRTMNEVGGSTGNLG